MTMIKTIYIISKQSWLEMLRISYTVKYNNYLNYHIPKIIKYDFVLIQVN
jgi:hypothetical protein